MSFFGSSFGSPSICPHCRSQVDLTPYGTVSAHMSRGSACTGSGLPPTATLPWPGTTTSIKAAASTGTAKVRRFTRRANRSAGVPAAH